MPAALSINVRDNEGLIILDISDPSHPIFIGHCDTPGNETCVFVLRNYAYVTDGNLRIIDISTPSNPIEVGHCDTPHDAQEVFVTGNYAYVTDGTLRIIDVSDPSNPVEGEIVSDCEEQGFSFFWSRS